MPESAAVSLHAGDESIVVADADTALGGDEAALAIGREFEQGYSAGGADGAAGGGADGVDTRYDGFDVHRSSV